MIFSSGLTKFRRKSFQASDEPLLVFSFSSVLEMSEWKLDLSCFCTVTPSEMWIYRIMFLKSKPFSLFLKSQKYWAYRLDFKTLRKWESKHIKPLRSLQKHDSTLPSNQVKCEWMLTKQWQNGICWSFRWPNGICLSFLVLNKYFFNIERNTRFSKVRW